MVDFATLQAIDQTPAQAVPAAAAPPAPVVPPTQATAASGDDASVVVLGPITEARYRNNPPSPPAAGLTGYDLKDATDDYNTYLNWKAQQAAPANPSAKPAQMDVVAPTQAAGPPAIGGIAPGGTAAAANSDPLAKFKAADAASDAAIAQNSAAKGAAAPAATPNSDGTKPKTGYVANAAAGVNQGIAQTLGGPVDLMTGALNLVPRAINAAAGTNLPTIQNPVGGSTWLEGAMGLVGADPRTVVPAGPGEQLLRSATEGATSALLPMGPAGKIAGMVDAAASPVAAGVARTMAEAPAGSTAVSGAAAGVGGTAAADVVPEPYKPYAALAGQLVGGGLAAGAAAAGMKAAQAGASAVDAVRGAVPVGTAQPVLDAAANPIAGTSGAPVTATRTQAARVGAAFADRAGMTPSQLAEQLPPAGQAPLVPGSTPTVGQSTGNTGMLALERELGTVSPEAREAFADRRVQQNSAQLEHLATLRPEDAQAHAAGNYFVGRLNQIDAQEAAAVAAAHQKYRGLADKVGGVAHPADIGGAIAQQVDQGFAPALRQADAAIATAQGRVADAAQQAGGTREAGEGETARQGYGQALRDELAGIQKAANAERRALYDARDPDGKLAIAAAPIRTAARDLRKELRPHVGDSLTPREEALISAAEKLPAVASMGDVASFRKNVNAALQESNAARNLGTPGAAEAVRRLTILKHSVDEAEAEATERAAHPDGEAIKTGAAPEDTVLGRLAQHAAEGDNLAAEAEAWYNARRGESLGSVRSQSNAGRAASGGSRRVSPAHGGASQAAPGPSASPSASRIQGQRPAESLTSLLIRHGGIKEESGELAAMGFTNRTHPTLVRSAGLSHDAARELAIENGFLPPDSLNAPNVSSTADVRNLLAAEAAGRKQYAPETAYEVHASQDATRQRDITDHALDEARGRVYDYLDDGSSDHMLPEDWVRVAALDVARGRSVHEAVSDAQTGFANETMDADTRARYFGSEPGLNPRAHQQGLPVDGQDGSLTENLTAEDAARFKAADAFNREYQRRFGPKTAAGQALATGPGGDFKMELSKVAANFWKRGPAGAESSQQLVSAMGSREAAERAIGDYAAHDLRAFARTSDGLSAVKLQSWLDAHADALNEFPALRQKFGTLQKAQATLETIKQRRAELEALNPVRLNATNADALAQFVKPGPKGGEAVDAYVKSTGGTASARQAIADGFAYALRSEQMKDGELTSKGFDAFRAKYASALDRVPEVKAAFDTLANATKSAEAAAVKAQQARSDYLRSVASHYLNKGGEPVEPQAAVQSILRSPTGPADAGEIVQHMRGDSAALKGLRLNFADWLTGHVTNTAEAGTSGIPEISTAKLQRLVKDPKTMAVLEKVFTPEQVKGVVEAVAANAKNAARSYNATKILGSPGTAADLRATESSDPHADVAGAMGAEVAGELAGHVLGLGTVASILVRGGAIAGRIYYGAAKAAGIQTERDLMTQAVLNPELMRALLAAARAPSIRPSVMTRIKGVLANLAVSGANMQPSPDFSGKKR